MLGRAASRVHGSRLIVDTNAAKHNNESMSRMTDATQNASLTRQRYRSPLYGWPLEDTSTPPPARSALVPPPPLAPDPPHLPPPLPPPRLHQDRRRCSRRRAIAIAVAAANRLGAASNPATAPETAAAPLPAPISLPTPQWALTALLSFSPPPPFRRRGVCRCRPCLRRPRHLNSPPPRHHQLHHRPSRC